MAFLKKTLLLIAIILATLLGVASLTGLTPRYIMAAPGVATGIGAKLLCSSRHVSGFSAEQSFQDLVQYSPVLKYLTIEYDDTMNAVHTSLFGLSNSTASFIPMLGCSLDYPGFNRRQDSALTLLVSVPQADLWPKGALTRPSRQDIQAVLQTQLDEDNSAGLNTRALVVIHQGELIAEVYAQNATAQTMLHGWSMAKSLNSIMLGNLEMRGLLDIDSGPGFDVWSQDNRSRISVRDMLTMTDGLGFAEQYDPGDDATAMLFTEPSAADFALTKLLENEPGTVFNYSSGTANLLSKLYQLKTGGNFQDSYRDYYSQIHQKLGFQNSVFETDASGVFVGSSYVYASARDWARLGQLMLNEGEINGHRIVSEDWVRRSTNPNQSNNERAYGYQWWLNRGDEALRWPAISPDAFSAQGNRQQWIMVVPSQDLVYVRLGWTAGRYPIAEHVIQVIESL